MLRPTLIAATALGFAAPLLAAGPLQVTSTVMVEAKTRAPDGSTRVALAPAKRVVPGDRVVYVIAYRNTGGQPLSGVVIANPVPATLSYRSAAAGTPDPEVSVDGTTFAPLAALRVAQAGTTRPATADDVRLVRWRVPVIAPGAEGRFAFQAVLK